MACSPWITHARRKGFLVTVTDYLPQDCTELGAGDGSLAACFRDDTSELGLGECASQYTNSPQGSSIAIGAVPSIAFGKLHLQRFIYWLEHSPQLLGWSQPETSSAQAGCAQRWRSRR